MKQKLTTHKGFLQRSWLTYRPLCTWLVSRLFCGEQAGTAQGRCSWETGQASSGRPAGTWDNTVSIHFYVAASMTALTDLTPITQYNHFFRFPKGRTVAVAMVWKHWQLSRFPISLLKMHWDFAFYTKIYPYFIMRNPYVNCFGLCEVRMRGISFLLQEREIARLWTIL